jgi:hypothetical protein
LFRRRICDYRLLFLPDQEQPLSSPGNLAPGWLIESRLYNATPSLHPVSGISPLLRVAPPLVSASVLSPSWFFHWWLLRSHRSSRSHVVLDRPWATLMPDVAPSVNRRRQGCSRSNDSLRFDIVFTVSTRPQWFPCGPLLASHLTRFFPGLFLLCSPPWRLPTPPKAVWNLLRPAGSESLPSSIQQLHPWGPPRPFARVAHNRPRAWDPHPQDLLELPPAPVPAVIIWFNKA